MQRWLGTLPLLLLLWGPAQAADVEAGKAKATVCAACHGVEGKALIPNYPHLAGQNAAYLVKQLKAFKDGSRKEPLMVPFMAPLSDADMENLAAYYASLK
ncbi:cytochrome C [Aeromonas hydrophila]|uniref:c-type cytochrome n=1 Tax=Aeromonas hydrophila TaxID=644 RepID=UPI0011171156|nr:cytochrome c [Aeromonas hydrophila]TNH67456.1 cytochrome C [Aeromonas hydrophila]